MRIKSIFENNAKIPDKYSYYNGNVSPYIEIAEAPSGTKSFALIIDDPDAPVGDWVHWLLWNIPANTRIIQEGKSPSLAVFGTNDFGNLNYGGPCPPSGTHRYFFKLYALDSVLGLKAGAKKHALLSAMQGHIIEKAELVGLYSK